MSDTPDSEYIGRLEQAVARLPKIQRDILLARQLDRMTYGEIAFRTGLSVRRVQVHMGHAIYGIDRQMRGLPLRWWHRWF